MHIGEISVMLYGPSSVGKSWLASRFARDESNPPTRATVAMDFLSRTVSLEGEPVEFVLYDMSGNTVFESQQRKFLNSADCVVFVFDQSDAKSSMKELKKYVDRFVARSDREDCVSVLVGNKTDLVKTIAMQPIVEFTAEIGASAYLFTSAKTGKGVKELFQSIGRLVRDKHRMSSIPAVVGEPSPCLCC